MIYWKTKALVDKLKNDEITDKEKFKYFLFVMIILMSGELIHSLDRSEEVLPVWAEALAHGLSILITVLGLIKCFKTNAKGDGKDYVVRVCCLSFPIATKLFVFSMGLFAIYAMGYTFYMLNYIVPFLPAETVFSTWYSNSWHSIWLEGLPKAIIVVAVAVIFVIRLNIAIRKVSETSGVAND